MKNYICINDQKIELTNEQVQQIMAAKNIEGVKLMDYAPGATVKIGNFEMVVLEQMEGQTALILKGMYGDCTEFGEDNNYNGSYVDKKCQEFAQQLSEIVGWDNIVLHQVDLTADDGLKGLGMVERRASAITAQMYRKYVEILDKVNPRCWWWLATAFSIPPHDHDNWVKCVSPSGYVNYHYHYDGLGVRPFCILKSTIFVSE